MYNIENLKKIETEIQQELDKITEKYSPIIQAAIEKEMMKGHNFTIGMGTAFIENKHGEHVAEKFSGHVSLYQYKDCFNTSLNIENIKKP